ncbi:MAG: hypothetical protein V4614_14885 [Pseudomonadota bacterium]
MNSSRLVKILLFALWVPTLACAAMTSTVQSSETFNVPVWVLAANFLVSLAAGVTTLAIRINAQLYAAPDKPIPFMKSFCFAHMLGSLLTGGFFFLISQHQQLGLWMGLAVVLLGSFAGAKALEKAVEHYLPMRSNSILPKESQ